MTEETKEQEDEQSIVLRTLLRKEVMDRLTSFCKLFSTGRDHWDYGVGIQILLDFYYYNNKVATVQELSMKLDMIRDMMPVEKEEIKVEEPKTELLNGEKV